MFDTACMLDDVFPESNTDFIQNLVLSDRISVVSNYKIIFFCVEKFRYGFLERESKKWQEIERKQVMGIDMITVC